MEQVDQRKMDLYEEGSIEEYLRKTATEKSLFLDSSRLKIVQKNSRILSLMLKGQKRNQNRYRQLLLGSKSMGKSALLSLFKSLDHYFSNDQNLIIISKSFDTCKSTTSTLIVNELLKKSFGKDCENKLTQLLTLDDISDIVDELEKMLIARNVYVFCLFDEFQFVYKNGSVGSAIVQDIARWSNTNGGRFHCIVTGSSTILRKLVFAKFRVGNAAIKEEYPGYDGIDLNPTKLQPQWIHPLTRNEDILSLLAIISTKNQYWMCTLLKKLPLSLAEDPD